MPEEIYLAPNASLSLVAGANITLSSGSGNVTIIGGANPGATTFLAGVSIDGNTAGTTGAVNNQIEFVGGTNITLSQSKNLQSATISVIGATFSESFGMSNLGNTDGTSGMASASKMQFVLVGGSNITLSQSLNVGSGAGTITINGPADVDPQPAELILPVTSNNASGTLTQFYAMADHQHRGVFSAGISTGGNTAGTTGVYPCQLVLVGGTNITLSQSVNSTNGLTISVIGPAENTLEQWIPLDYGGASTAQQIGQSTLKVFPGFLEGPGSFSLVDAYISATARSNSASQYSGTLSFAIGVYTRNASSLSLATSGSQSFSYQNHGTSSIASITGLRHCTVPIGLSMPAGNYWIGFLSMTASATAGDDGATFSNFGALIAPAWVNDFNAAQNATHQYMPGLGHYSVQTAALPASIGFSELVGSNSSTMAPYLDFLNFNFT